MSSSHAFEGDDAALLALLNEAAKAVEVVLADVTDWGPSNTKAGQYLSDLAADEAAVAVLTEAGLGVLSEESGRHFPERSITAVVDPLDGSTNASRPISWFATSICAVDHLGPRAGVVVDLVHGVHFQASRGGGAWRNGERLQSSPQERLGSALIGINGLPDRHLGWAQFRALGAAALDLCAVAEGRLDGFVDCTNDGLAPWDYLGALLLCEEAGAKVADLRNRPLVDFDHGARRTIIAGGTSELFDALATSRSNCSPAPWPGVSDT